MIDLLWSPRLTKENFSRYVEMENLDLWLDALKPGKPVVFGSGSRRSREIVQASCGNHPRTVNDSREERYERDDI